MKALGRAFPLNLADAVLGNKSDEMMKVYPIALEEAMGMLRETERHVLLRIYRDNLDVKQIAKEMDTPKNVVIRRQNRGINKIRKEIRHILYRLEILTNGGTLPYILIKDMGLSTRSFNCLNRAGIIGLSELIVLSETEVRNIRNLGDKSLEEIKNAIGKLGYTLRPE